MCQDVARGPVSDSPSPTTAVTIKSGLSKAAPQACEHVPKFASFVDRAGSFRCTVTTDTARKGKLLEERAQPFGVLTLIRIDLRIGSF